MKQTFVLNRIDVRHRAYQAIRLAPEGHVVTIAEPTRSGDQNSKLWAMLTDIARAKPEGRQWPPETWKGAFMHALGHEVQFAEGLDGRGPFPLGYRTSRLSKREFSDLIMTIAEYGDRHGVKWQDPKFAEEWR